MMKMPLILAAAAALTNAGTAHANYIVNIAQSGSDVTASGSGVYDFTPLSFTGFDFPISVAIDPSTAYLGFGNEDSFGTPGSTADNYISVSGPVSFGSGGLTLASSTSGSVGGINGSISELIVPPGYPPNGSTIDSLTTWDNTTIAGLGLTPGTYVWTWSGGNSFTLNIAGSVPEPGSWALMLAGFGLVGYALRKQARASYPIVKFASN